MTTSKFVPNIQLKTKRDLVKALSDNGLPCSSPKLYIYEAEGIIKYPNYGFKRGQAGYDRLYTDTEIELAVESVRQYAISKKPHIFNKSV